MNLKKSWHPSTLKNQAKVWKAEQQDEHEKRKTEQLQQELQSQREKEHYQVRVLFSVKPYESASTLASA